MPITSGVILETIPWWAALYIGLFAGLLLFGAILDLRRTKRARWHVALDILSGALLILLMVGRWQHDLVAPLGAWAAAVFSAVVGWDVYSTGFDLAELDYDPDLTPRENEATNWIGTLVGAVLVAPAYALALFSVVRAWRGG